MHNDKLSEIRKSDMYFLLFCIYVQIYCKLLADLALLYSVQQYGKQT